jgi:hypothetical protein
MVISRLGIMIGRRAHEYMRLDEAILRHMSTYYMGARLNAI